MQVIVNEQKCVVYVCRSSYYLQQRLLSATLKQIGLIRLHAQRTIFSANCYGHAFMVTVNALQPIFCGWYLQTGQITEQRNFIISLQPTTVLLHTL